MTKFVRCGWTFYLQNPASVSFQGSLRYIIKDNALNDVFVKTLGILSFYSARKKMYYLMGNYVLETF